MPGRRAAPAASMILAAMAIIAALAGVVTAGSLWSTYQAAESTAAQTRVVLDDALADARGRADAVISAQEDTERLREFAVGQANCLRVNPWSPLCNNWNAQSALATAEASLAGLESEMDVAFERVTGARGPYEAARAGADAAYTSFLGAWVAASVVVTALLGAAIRSTVRGGRAPSSDPSGAGH
ncbi:hypothetical protein [Microbacterium sp. bgisy207]|uniref:hypothetical protein n=1 Tax=Microbacterium sp. bgisy207 TaxID=3413800 RepID=UPI003EBB6629